MIDLYIQLQQTLQKINLTVLGPGATRQACFDNGLRGMIDPNFDYNALLTPLLAEIAPGEIGLFRDDLGLLYAAIRCHSAPDNILSFGPYIIANTNCPEHFCSALPKEADRSFLTTFYDNLPVLDDPERLHGFLYRIASYGEDNVQYVLREVPCPPELFVRNLLCKLLFQIEDAAFEANARLENKMIQSLLQCDLPAATDAAGQLLQLAHGIEQTFPFYSFKYRMIELNTLLRITLEQHGIHPRFTSQVYLRAMQEIDLVTTPYANNQLICRIIQDYAACLEEYRIKNYSPMIQKCIVYITLHLSEALSLNTVASYMCLSSSYVSSQFRKEVGITLTDYIVKQRIRRAERLLLTTTQTIESIAQDVGILDISYFTRLFKREKGLPPSLYRKQYLSANHIPPYTQEPTVL